MLARELNVLDSEEKEEYFTEIWNRTCSTFYYLKSIRAYHIAKWGEDLYDPKGYGKPDQIHKYLTDSFNILFDHNAQEEFNKLGDWGNGEYIFIDKNGTTGFM